MQLVIITLEAIAVFDHGIRKQICLWLPKHELLTEQKIKVHFLEQETGIQIYALSKVVFSEV